jgi:hypothetical protein
LIKIRSESGVTYPKRFGSKGKISQNRKFAQYNPILPVLPAATPSMRGMNSQSFSRVFRLENDWWTIDAAGVGNKHLTLALGCRHCDSVLNHK